MKKIIRKQTWIFWEKVTKSNINSIFNCKKGKHKLCLNAETNLKWKMKNFSTKTREKRYLEKETDRKTDIERNWCSRFPFFSPNFSLSTTEMADYS